MIIQVIDEKKLKQKGYRGYDEIKVDEKEINAVSDICRLVGVKDKLFKVTKKTLREVKEKVKKNGDG